MTPAMADTLHDTAWIVGLIDANAPAPKNAVPTKRKKIFQTETLPSLHKVGRFEHWVNITAGLEELAKDTDAKVAVAQDYGLATNFIDFSTEAKVAGFFATEGAGASSSDKEACIICLDADDLVRMWTEIMRDQVSPELLRVKVDDLWRLQAQYGVFLCCLYVELDTRYLSYGLHSFSENTPIFRSPA